MNKKRLIELKKLLDNSDPNITDPKLLIKEVLSDLLRDADTASIEDMFLALNCINLTPTVVFDKLSDSYLITNDLFDNTVTYTAVPLRLVTICVEDHLQFLSLRDAFKHYINEKLQTA